MYQIVIKENIKTAENTSSARLLIVAGTFVGLIGGLLLMLAGLFLSLEIYVTKISFHGIEVVFLSLAFVLLGIGAHCLDLMEKGKKAKRNK